MAMSLLRRRFPHPSTLPCGFKLVNDGHDRRTLRHYLGHKNVQHTVRYTEMVPDRFKDSSGARGEPPALGAMANRVPSPVFG